MPILGGAVVAVAHPLWDVGEEIPYRQYLPVPPLSGLLPPVDASGDAASPTPTALAHQPGDPQPDGETRGL